MSPVCKSNNMPKIWLGSAGHADMDSDCDCDCACPENYGPAFYQSKLAAGWAEAASSGEPGFALHERLYTHPLGDYTLAVPPDGPGVMVIDRQAAELLRCVQEKRSLQALQGRWPEGALRQAAALFLAMGIFQPRPSSARLPAPAAAHPQQLAAWLHLTSRCTLSCPYCYVAPAAERMTSATARQSVTALFQAAQRHGYAAIKLKYAGGEPSLNFAALQAAQLQAELLSQENGILLQSVLLTNGVRLSHRQIEFLAQHHIRVTVSLDGLGQVQSVQRPLAQGQEASFPLVERTLYNLQEAGLRPGVMVTLTRRNLPGLPELVTYLLERNLHFSLNFYRPTGPSAEALQALMSPPQELIASLRRTYQVIEGRLPRYSLLSSLSDRADLLTPRAHTCGVGRNYLVIGSQGQIAKCQMELGQWVTGIWAADPLAVVWEDQAGLQGPAVSAEQCKDCPWVTRCTGGCPRLTRQYSGSYAAPSPYCEVYQAILPEIARLEGLRMLRYEQPWDFSLME